MKVKCPRCKNETEYSSENAFRPFCSQRCRDIDLGAWLTGENAIVGDSTPAANPADSEDEEVTDERKH